MREIDRQVNEETEVRGSAAEILNADACAPASDPGEALMFVRTLWRIAITAFSNLLLHPNIDKVPVAFPVEEHGKRNGLRPITC